MEREISPSWPRRAGAGVTGSSPLRSAHEAAKVDQLEVANGIGRVVALGFRHTNLRHCVWEPEIFPCGWADERDSGSCGVGPVVGDLLLVRFNSREQLRQHRVGWEHRRVADWRCNGLVDWLLCSFRRIAIIKGRKKIIKPKWS